MKRHFIVLWILTVCLTGCVTEHINTVLSTHELHEIRLRKLKDFCAKVNEEILALQLIIESGWGQSDYITDIQTTSEGYQITFAQGGTVQVYHGAKGDSGNQGGAGQNGQDGQDGESGKDGLNGLNAPVIGVKKHTDGLYYWTTTLNGTTNWLTGEAGEKLLVTGSKGENGSPGTPGENGTNGVLPVLSVNADGYWIINGTLLLHNGQPVPATGAPGESGEPGKDQVETGPSGDLLIKEVLSYPDSVVFVLTQNEIRFSVPLYQKPTITIHSIAKGTFFLGQTLPVKFTCSSVASVIAIVPAGWQAQVDFNARKVTLTAPSENDPYAIREGELTLITSNAKGESITTSLPLSAIRAYEVKDWEFTDSRVYHVLNLQGVKVAEVCHEYIPGYSEEQPAIVVYPYYVEDKRYGKGFVVNGGGTVYHDGSKYAGKGEKGPSYPVVYITYKGITTETPVDYAPTQQEADVVKDIDGNLYPITKISTYYWLAKNWEAEHYTDGSPVERIDNAVEWDKQSTAGKPLCAYCYNKPAYKKVYGMYYNGYAVFSGKLFPPGWRLPTCDFVSGDNECQKMMDFLGKRPAIKLRSTGFGSNKDQGEWDDRSGTANPLDKRFQGNNLSGFNALSGGMRVGDEDRYLGGQGYWWTSTPLPNSNKAFYYSMDLRNYMEIAVVPGAPDFSIRYGGTVRLIRDYE